MDSGREPNRRSALADFGLVSMVVGGGAAFLLGMVAIGSAAFLGRIPLTVGLLFVVASLAAVFGLVVTIAAVRKGASKDGSR